MRRRATARRSWLAAAALAASCGGAGDPAAPAPTHGFAFRERADSGIDGPTTSGRLPTREILEVDGGGLGLIDQDGDGDLDLLVIDGATLETPERGPGSRLYRAVGAFDFVDATAEVALDLHRWGMGVAVGDCDGDGWDDAFATCFGPDALLHNEGGARLVDVGREAGVADPRWGTSAAFADLDRDGDLDLFVANYLEFDPRHPPPRSSFKGVPVMLGPVGLPKVQSALYENVGPLAFRDVSLAAGIELADPGYGLGVLVADFDGDGWLDVFQANDSTPNALWRNLGGLTFEEIGRESGVAFNIDGNAQASMGCASADVDGNGLPDVFVTNFSSDTNTLHLARRRGGAPTSAASGASGDGGASLTFEDRTAQYGLGLVSRPFLGWGCGFFDFDGDGDEDLFIANGHVFPEAATHQLDSTYEQAVLFFERRGARFDRLLDGGRLPFTTEVYRGRSTAFGDLDRDGDVDVLMSELNGPVRVFENASVFRDWLVVECRAGAGDSHAIGARLELEQAGDVQRRWILGGASFQAASEPAAFFALAAAGTAPATLRVRWPTGDEQVFDGLIAGERVSLTRGSSQIAREPLPRR